MHRNVSVNKWFSGNLCIIFLHINCNKSYRKHEIKQYSIDKYMTIIEWFEAQLGLRRVIRPQRDFMFFPFSANIYAQNT